MLLLAAAIAASAQGTPPAEDPVVVTIRGKSYTRQQLETMVKSVGGGVSANFFGNKRAFIEQWALIETLTALAEKAGMPEQEPYASRLHYSRAMTLATALMSEKQREFIIRPEQQQQYFEEHKQEYSRARTKLIYLPFTSASLPGAKKIRTDDETRLLAEDVVRKLRAGANFVDLVKQYSEDPESRIKDGDYPAFKPTDNALPAALRTIVFGLNPGEVSDPIKQANAYYIFRLEEFVIPRFEEVKDDIYTAIQKERFDAWMNEVRKDVGLEIKDEKYFSTPGPA